MGLTPISEIETPSIQAPTIRLSQADIETTNNVADGRYKTGYRQSHRLQKQTMVDDGLDAHSVGTRGEAALCMYLDGDLRALDREARWDGDDGTDLTLRGYDIDVKTTTHGWDSGKEPLLRIERRHFEDPTHTPDLYYLVEECITGMYRLIGFIPADEVEDVCDYVDEGEYYRGFKSQTDNVVVRVEHLTMVTRDWSPESYYTDSQARAHTAD